MVFCFADFDRQVNGYRGLTKAELIQGNAEELPVADSSLDVVSKLQTGRAISVAAAI
jgi:ubiquinone/menaquinone biosynthesis C-methylase UbiE